MKQLLQIALGIVTSVGGFLEIGSITTAAQAGAGFGYQLGWSILLGTLCIAFLVEMSGRFSACSRRTIPDAMRERFGANLFAFPLLVMLGVSLLVLAAEIGGVAAAIHMATGIALPVWVIPVAVLSWALLWRSTFSLIENGVSLLGLVTVVFAVAAVRSHPDYGSLAAGLIPRFPHAHRAHYWFVAVSVLGASISPYLYYFYSSGAIEEKWDTSYLVANRFIAGIGMAFGGGLSVAVLVLGAIVFFPHGRDVNRYQDLATRHADARPAGVLALPRVARHSLSWRDSGDRAVAGVPRRAGVWMALGSGPRATRGCAVQSHVYGADCRRGRSCPRRHRSAPAHATVDGAHGGVAPGRRAAVPRSDERRALSRRTHERATRQRGGHVRLRAGPRSRRHFHSSGAGRLMIEHLVADVLDVQVVDKHGKNAGRIDGIILTWSPETRPVVAFIEISPITLLARFNRRLARAYARWDERFGEGRGVPFRFPGRESNSSHARSVSTSTRSKHPSTLSRTTCVIA